MKRLRYWPILLALLTLPTGVRAHPVDVYLQGTLVVIRSGEIRLQINLTPGASVAGRVLDLIDLNHDGVISSNECAGYAELLKHDLVAWLDGRAVELKFTASDFPEPAELRSGWGIIQIEYSVTPGALAAGPHKFILENRHRPVASTYLINAARPESALIQITGQKRNEDQSTGEIAFNFHPPPDSSRTFGIVVSLAAIFVVVFAGLWYARKRRRIDLQQSQSPVAANLEPKPYPRLRLEG